VATSSNQGSDASAHPLPWESGSLTLNPPHPALNDGHMERTAKHFLVPFVCAWKLQSTTLTPIFTLFSQQPLCTRHVQGAHKTMENIREHSAFSYVAPRPEWEVSHERGTINLPAQEITYSLNTWKAYKGHCVTQINLIAPKKQRQQA
jgi:hypothetical protein